MGVYPSAVVIEMAPPFPSDVLHCVNVVLMITVSLYGKRESIPPSPCWRVMRWKDVFTMASDDDDVEIRGLFVRLTPLILLSLHTAVPSSSM